MSQQITGDRLVVLDTETTGLDPASGHRIIEIGAVEINNRRLSGEHFHHYCQPDRKVDPGAFEVHGISDAFLVGKPKFAELADDFLAFIDGAELIIHNAPFDVGFLDAELQRMGKAERINQICNVVDSLAMARKRHPGQRNSLDALCKRYGVDNSRRELHGALLDSEILADVYLLMTGGQVGLSLVTDAEPGSAQTGSAANRSASLLAPRSQPLPVVAVTDAELADHQRYLEMLEKKAGVALWPASE